MTMELDCRGLACPAPVLKTKQIMEKDHPERIVVLVDNKAAKENVSRFLSSQGFQVSAEEEGPDFRVTGTSGKESAPRQRIEALDAEPGHKKIMVMVATDSMGQGDDELGRLLLVNFLKTLKEMGRELWRLVFVNNGVKLTVEGSEILPTLKELEADGILILVCGTCLNHFKLLEKKLVGETTNMLDIVTAMQLADKVITI